MPAAAEAMNRDEILAEIDDMIEVLRRYVYDERHNRVGWRDRNEIKTKYRKLGNLIEALGDYFPDEEP